MLIIDITSNNSIITINIIKLLYKILDKFINLIINNILYLLDTSANLIFISKF